MRMDVDSCGRESFMIKYHLSGSCSARRMKLRRLWDAGESFMKPGKG